MRQLIVFGHEFVRIRAWSELSDRSAHVELVDPDGATLRCAWDSLMLMADRGIVAWPEVAA